MTSLDPIGAVMLVRVWEYEVVAARAAEFERLYGSTGAWARLFASSRCMPSIATPTPVSDRFRARQSRAAMARSQRHQAT